MNLITVLKKIIVTETKREKDRGTTLFSQVIDKKLVQLKSTYHQRKERFGKESYDDIVDMYNDYLSTRKSKYQQPPRLAVPDSMVKNLFSDSLEKIYNSFETEKPDNNQIIFVKKRKNNEESFSPVCSISVLLAIFFSVFFLFLVAHKNNQRFIIFLINHLHKKKTCRFFLIIQSWKKKKIRYFQKNSRILKKNY